ncbi:MAG TPA: UDP-4-amino-4,6-dideoxy-N-acetyl-beta-L-altrosamine transaminase [Kofleriaceae bacterium]|nr:UDP-4-amino-4,6-dideoxy-N-acetyl-beta-L-altrosamine transaminase [Kofleriaceae bacterium]
MTRLPYGRQTIADDDIAAIADALRAPLLTCGPLVARFEAALAGWLGAPHATVCASGTAALHLAYAALGIGAGDEIITTPITFSATAAAAYYVGASVRIADVDPRTGNLTAASVEPLINRRTRAIVPVHLGGLPADMAELSELAHRHGLRVIEDACHALGATYRGVRIGGIASDAVVFSFHPVKHITTGEGGAVIVRDPDVQRRLDRLRQHGIERDHARLDAPAGPWVYEVQELGWNYRLSDIACALGLAQLAKLEGFLADRRRLAAHYRSELARAFGGDGVAAPAELADRESAYHLFAVAIDFERFATTRARVMSELAAAGIGTQVHYIPLLHHPLHARRCPDEITRPRPGAARYYACTLSLPLYPTLSTADASRVVGELHRVLRGSP